MILSEHLEEVEERCACVFGGLPALTHEVDEDLHRLGGIAVDREGPREPQSILFRTGFGRLSERRDVTDASFTPADVVCAVYSLGELGASDREVVVRRAWDATVGVLIVIEPGTPSGSGTVLGIRDALIDAGAELLAPCPHAERCPMLRTDKWCHFPARLERSEQHRRAKGAELPFEDERYSYVAFSRVGGERVPGRIVGHPRYPRRRVDLEVCAPDRLLSLTVPRSDPRYADARSVAWGDAFGTS